MTQMLGSVHTTANSVDEHNTRGNYPSTSSKRSALCKEIALQVQQAVTHISPSSNLPKAQYRSFANFIFREVNRLVHYRGFRKKRFSQRHNDPLQPPVPLRPFWIWKEKNKSSIEVQIIHSGPEAIVGTGKFKEIVKSTHLTFLLGTAHKVDRIFFRQTVCMKIYTPISDHHAVKMIETQGVEALEKKLDFYPKDFLGKIQEIETSLFPFRGEIHISGLGTDRHPFLETQRRILVQNTAVTFKQTVLEMEEELYAGDLYQLNSHLTLHQKLQVLLDVGKTLVKLHQNTFIHRDVKGPNILVDTTGLRAKGVLSDFDISCSECQISSSRNPYLFWDSATRRGHVTRAADIYGFAATIGASFFGNEFYACLKIQNLVEEPQQLILKGVKDLFSSIGNPITEEVLKSLKKLPRKHFCSTVLEKLQELITQLTTPGHPYHQTENRGWAKEAETLMQQIFYSFTYPKGPLLHPYSDQLLANANPRMYPALLQAMQIICEVMRANQSLLFNLELGTTLTSDRIESLFPSMESICERLQNIQNYVAQLPSIDSV